MRASTSGAWASKLKYDVFVSFRGEDTRKNFTAHLYEELHRRGIKIFRDDRELERGTSISEELLGAIEKSRFAVVVVSPNYASSTWCLLELAEIVQCMGERGQILPIFYDVDPSDVRHQTGSFAKAFGEHEENSGEDLTKVKEWRKALTTVANLAGWTSKDKYEPDIIKEIVDDLTKKKIKKKEIAKALWFATSESSEHLVGISSKELAIRSLLETEASDVSFIGIWGMGGIGKTTLAKHIYHSISPYFEVSIFLADVRQAAKHELPHLQEQLLCQISEEKNVRVWNVDDGRSETKRCLLNKKVLLVLDDVDQLDQLENLAGGKDWFGSGSIVIVTTRDRHLLVSHGIEKRYESKGLNQCDALQLFRWYAFKKDHPEEDYSDLYESILDYAGGLPLALRILGSFLHKRDRGCWESAVDQLKKAPIGQKLYEALRISYDGLDDETHQQVFLDVVCFLKGNDKERVIKILDSIFGFDTRVMIDVLIDKSLLTIFDNCVDMHDLIQEMGGEIVRLKSKEEPGKRSRLWLRDDILCVLKENEGTKTIRSIALCLPKSTELACNPNAFSKMSKLKFLKMQNLVLCQGPEYLPDSIRVLEWSLYPSKSLPPNFHPVELLELILHHSKIDQLWHGIKYLEKLTLIDLSYSENLIMTPDFKGIQNLERLVLEGCTNLVDIHPSITSLRRLKVLNFKNCRSIKSLPSELEMDSLELVDLSGCSKVYIFPQFVAQMQKLSELSFSGIGMQNIEVICHSVAPHPLSLVLASLKHFCSLKGLNLNDCRLGEGAIPDDIGCLSSLEDLDLSVNNFVSLPATISQLSKLKCLNLADCKWLQQLPDLPLFSGTCYVAADNCISLKKLPDPPAMCGLWKLSFNFINCCSIAIEDDGEDGDIEDDGVSSYITYSILQPFLQEPPPFVERFSIVIPGNDIPVWFTNRSDAVIPGNDIPVWLKNRSDAVRIVERHCYLCRRNLWVGFALCVLFGPKENPGALGEDPDLKPHANTISCDWRPVILEPASFMYSLNKVVKSDHLCLFLLPSMYYRPDYGDSDTRFIFLFKTDHPCLKVKKCGVRTLYKQDEKEHKSSMNHRNKTPLSDEVFSTLFPENDIPKWFKEIWKGDLVCKKLPCSSCRGWIGFVVCVLFGAAAPGEDHDLEPHANRIVLKWSSAIPDHSPYMCDVEQVELSDQLCVFFVPMNKFILGSYSVKFRLETKGAACLKVKSCGVRTLYMRDVIELNTTMDEYPESMSPWYRIPGLLLQLKSMSRFQNQILEQLQPADRHQLEAADLEEELEKLRAGLW